MAPMAISVCSREPHHNSVSDGGLKSENGQPKSVGFHKKEKTIASRCALGLEPPDELLVWSLQASP